jgi:nitrate/nitrite transporter NarK
MDKAAAKRGMALFALGCAGSTIYIVPYLRYVFYDKMIAVMQISNAQLGSLMIGYTSAAIVLLFFGGAVADKYSSKLLIQLSLLGTTILTVIFAFTLSYHAALAIWIALAATTGFVFWPALMIAVGRVGTPEKMGRMYGFYYAAKGLCAAFFNALAVYLASKIADPHESLFWAIIIIACSTAFSMVVMHFFYSDDVGEAPPIKPEERFQWKDFGKVLKNPYTWLFGCMGFCAFTVFSNSSYFTPYLTAVQGVQVESSEALAIVRTYLFMFLAAVGGLIADKALKSTAKFMGLTYIGVIILYLGLLGLPLGPRSAALYLFIPAALILAMYGIRYSVLRELPIRPQHVGTTIGVASMISWSGDMFTPTMLGYWLDKWGTGGYNAIFIYLTAIALVGAGIAAFIVLKRARWVKEKRLQVRS